MPRGAADGRRLSARAARGLVEAVLLVSGSSPCRPDISTVVRRPFWEHERAGPRRDPLFKTLVRSLPNDPAGQKTTGQEQGAGTNREYWSTTRGRERGRSRRSSGSGRTSRSRRGSSSGSRSGSSCVDVHVPASSDAAQTRAYLILTDTQRLGDTGQVLVVRDDVLTGRSGLDLVAVRILDTTTNSSSLRESWSSSGQNHG